MSYRVKLYLAILVGGTVSAAGCHTHRPLTGPLPIGESVRVSFDQFIPVPVTTAGETPWTVPVRELRGSVIAIHGDTLHVRVAGARAASGQTIPTRATAFVLQSTAARIEQERLAVGRTIAASVVGTVVGFMALGMILLAGAWD